MSEQETRIYHIEELEVRQATEDEPAIIRGYAAVYDQETDLGDFREVVKPGAFTRAIQRDDVRALFNHDPNYVMGRSKVGTLGFNDDAHGLGVTIKPPDTQWARDLITSMQRGDVDQMSFAFSVNEHTFNRDGEKPLRELRDVNLFDVSVVTYPAYPQTSAQARQEARDLALQATKAITDADDDQAVGVESDETQTDGDGQARTPSKARETKLRLVKRGVK